jgi:hypothetical protein
LSQQRYEVVPIAWVESPLVNLKPVLDPIRER